MPLNGQQIVKLIIGICFTLIILFTTPTLATTYKLTMIGIIWAAVVFGILARRNPS